MTALLEKKVKMKSERPLLVNGIPQTEFETSEQHGKELIAKGLAVESAAAPKSVFDGNELRAVPPAQVHDAEVAILETGVADIPGDVVVSVAAGPKAAKSKK